MSSHFPSPTNGTSSSRGLLILASFQANSHSPSEFLYSFRSTAPTVQRQLRNVVCRHPVRPHPRPPPTPPLTRISPSSLVSVCPPPIRVQLLLSHYHQFGRSTGSRSTSTSASLPFPWPHAFLRRPVKRARSIATEVRREAAIGRSLGVEVGVGEERIGPPP